MEIIKTILKKGDQFIKGYDKLQLPVTLYFAIKNGWKLSISSICWAVFRTICSIHRLKIQFFLQLESLLRGPGSVGFGS